MRSATLVPAALFALALSTPSAAFWLPDGTPQSPAPGYREAYTLSGLAADAAGGAYSILRFSADLPDFSGMSFTLSAQRVDALGDRPAPWAEAGTVFKSWINSSGSGTYSVIPLPMLEDGSGGALLPVIDITFEIEYVNRFRLFHVMPGGTVSPLVVVSNPSGWPVLDAAADGDGAGGVLAIAWQQTFAQPPQSPPPGALFVQHVDAAGNPQWPDLGSGAPGPALIPNGQVGYGGLAALADGAGGGFFAWVDLRDPADPDLYVQHVNAAGGVAAGWPAGGVQVCGAPGGQSEPHLASDGAGGVLVAWRDERDPVSHLYAHAVLASGALSPGIPVDGRQLPSSGVDDRFVAMAGDGFGGCFIVRASLTPVYSSQSRLHRLDAVMQPRAGWPAEGIPLNTLSPASGIVGLLADGLGGAFVSFRNGFGNVAPEGLYAQHFTAGGTPAAGWSADGYRLSGTGMESLIARSGSGAIVGWTDTRDHAMRVYAQGLQSDGPVAVQLALAGVTVGDDGVSLRWQAADAPGLHVAIERRGAEAAWTTLAEVDADGTGLIAYRDAEVAPGARYGYRVMWHDGAVDRAAAEVWVDVPGIVTLGLETPRPNPSGGPVRVTLALPRAAAARLDVIDIAGRQVAGRDLTALGVGRHVIVLDEAATLAPGVYLLRLTQDGVSRQTRLLRTR